MQRHLKICPWHMRTAKTQDRFRVTQFDQCCQFTGLFVTTEYINLIINESDLSDYSTSLLFLNLIAPKRPFLMARSN